MYFKLKYVEGAVPGKPLKKKKDADVAQKSKEYESKRERKFNPSCKQGRPAWLEYDVDAFFNHIVICLWEIYFCQSVRLTLAITLV